MTYQIQTTFRLKSIIHKNNRLFLTRFIFAFAIILYCFSHQELHAQPPVNCNWTFQSEIDCRIDCTLRVTCNGAVTDYPVTFLPGCCDAGLRSSNIINLSGAACTCLGCTFEIILDPSKPERMYNVTINGVTYKSICCNSNGGAFTCVKCRCGLLSFDCNTKTVTLLKSPTCICQ